jgi:hypothetical protein
MRLNIYDQLIVGVVRPHGGWSKGRPIAYIEEGDKCVPLFGLLIPNDLNDRHLAQYVAGKFRAFSRPGRRVELLHSAAPSHSKGATRRARNRPMLRKREAVEPTPPIAAGNRAIHRGGNNASSHGPR